MTTETETQLKARLRKEILQFGGVALSVHGHAMQEPGWPDLWISHKRCGGWWVELKMPNGKLTTAQRLRIRKINDAGGLAVVARALTGEVMQLESEDGAVLSRSFFSTGKQLVAVLEEP